MLLRPTALVLSMALLGDAALPAEAGPAPAAAAARVTPAATGLASSHQGRRKSRKKRRRAKRKPVKPTKFQNVTPYQHLGPGVSR